MRRSFWLRALPVVACLLAFVALPSCGTEAASAPTDAGTPPEEKRICRPGATEDCYSGSAATRGVGACKAGTRTCNADGLGFGPCEGDVLPATEVCDGAIVDEDCDGQVNEEGAGCACVPGSVERCYEGPSGTLGVGACAAGTKTCAADGKSYGPCLGQTRPSPEVCEDKLVDEDCDGQINEEGAGCTCVPGTVAACYEGPAGTAGVGACLAGTFTCLPSGEGYGPCTGQTMPAVEVCDGTLVDENCDGIVNEGGAGCVCVPGSTKSCYDGAAGTLGVGTCKAGIATCNAEGTGYGACVGHVLPTTDACNTAADEDCNGTSYTCTSSTQDCADSTGTCEDACSDAILGQSNVGCVFYPTVTANLVDSSIFHYGVAVANTSDKPAQVTVTKGAATITTLTVAARSAQVIQLPWDNTLKGPSSLNAPPMPASVRVNQGAYKLTATRGVTVFQFNALEYQIGTNFSYTNDASLLLPVNAWTGSYRVASRHHFAGTSGFVAVVAQADGTNVTFAAGPQTGQVKSGVTGISSTGTGTITMNAGDVVELVTNGGTSQSDPNDLTGMLVSSTKPIEVIGGHQCTYVPDTTGYCDHLEESMFPIEALDTQYIVTAPLIAANTPKVQIVRIIATAANTTLSYDPPQAGAPTAIAAAGGWAELPTSSNSFKVSASAKIMVQQYMTGQDAGGNAGDPAMTSTVPTSQFRTSYLFYAPPSYQTNFVNIVAPTGATVTLDGAPVATGSFTAIGATGYTSARLVLASSPSGFHTITGSLPVGVSVYGYGQYTSYWYPGGTK
jgi:IgGFc binding protein